LPGELKPLVRGWSHASQDGVEVWRQRHGETEWIAACAGMGAAAALRAWAAIDRDGAIDRVISTGWAGALGVECAVGSVCRAAEVIDARTGERFACSRPGSCSLVTSDRVAGPFEKRRLAAAHGAGLVDMEAAVIARLAAPRGIPFDCIKGVSDGPTGRLPDFSPFISARGQLRLTAFIGHAAVRPWMWPALIQLGRASRRAARRLQPALLAWLEEPA
jgi:adenosylhomocysteine nucleosidase